MSKEVVMNQAVDTIEEIVTKTTTIDPFDELPDFDPNDPQGNKKQMVKWAVQHGVPVKQLQENMNPESNHPVPANLYTVPYYHTPVN